MTSTSAPLEHPLLVAAHRLGDTLDETTAIDPLYLSTGEKGELLVELTRCLSRVAALRASVLAVAEDVAADGGARSAGAWLAVETLTSRREAAREERLGAALRARWPLVSEAAALGAVTWEQAEILVRSLDALPDSLDAELIAKAEAQLVAEAGQFGPSDLVRLGRRVLEVVAPDLADAEQERALRREERASRSATRLWFRPRGDGSTDLCARLPDSSASRLRVYLDAFTSPRRDTTSGEVDRPSPMRRRGEAFCALLEQPIDCPSTAAPPPR